MSLQQSMRHHGSFISIMQYDIQVREFAGCLHWVLEYRTWLNVWCCRIQECRYTDCFVNYNKAMFYLRCMFWKWLQWVRDITHVSRYPWCMYVGTHDSCIGTHNPYVYVPVTQMWPIEGKTRNFSANTLHLASSWTTLVPHLHFYVVYTRTICSLQHSTYYGNLILNKYIKNLARAKRPK